MAKIEWDNITERVYQSGVDHGVLYTQDGGAVPWNGLVGMDESSSSELKAYYLDGVKFLENLSPGEFQGKLKAITYPEELDQALGLAVVSPGFILTEQPPKSFNLSYRTKVGNPIEGTDYGYKIHILYNLLAQPDTRAYATNSDAEAAMEFTWNLTGTPPTIHKYRPTVHIVIDSRTTPNDVMAMLETRLYGSETSPPNLPSIPEVGEYFGYLGALIIIDNGDGTWTALDESGTFINMITETEFELDNVDAVYIDPDTYNISSTNVGGGF